MRSIGCHAKHIDRKKWRFEQCQSLELSDGFHFRLKAKSVERCRDEIDRLLPDRASTIWTAWHLLTHPFGLLPVDDKLKVGGDRRGYGHFRPSPENQAVWEAVRAQCDGVGASDLLFVTPTSFTPSADNIDNFKRFVAQIRSERSALGLIWAPEGLWAREQALEVAADTGMTLAIDPLVDKNAPLPAPEEGAYFQLLGRHGLRDRYSDDDLLELIEIAEPYEELTIIFKNAQPMRDIERFLTLESLGF